MHDRKPVRLPIGHIADAVDDSETTLLALFAASQGVWLTTRDLVAVNDLRRELAVCDYRELDRMVERAYDVMRRYLPEFTNFSTVTSATGISIAVLPDELALHRAEHEDRILERGSQVVPYANNRRIHYYLSEFVDAANTRHLILYRRAQASGRSPKDWMVLWEYKL